MMARRYVPVAEVARPHGVHGELRLKVYNHDSDLLLRRPAVKLQLQDGSERDVTIRSVRDVNKAILMKLAGVDDRDAAEALRSAKIAVARDAFPPLGEGEFYACDLEGARALLPSGEEVGRVVGLESYPTCEVLLIDRAAPVSDGAASGPIPQVSDGTASGPILPVTSSARPNQRIEIPLVEAYVASIDVERGVVELVTIDGLG